MRNQKWQPVTGSRYEITYVSACKHDGNKISPAIPMRWMSGNTTGLAIIQSDCADTEDIASKKYSLIVQINNVICNFSRVNSQTKIKLVKAYCISFYGAELWDLSHTDIESLCTAWRKGILWACLADMVPSLLLVLRLSQACLIFCLCSIYECLTLCINAAGVNFS